MAWQTQKCPWAIGKQSIAAAEAVTTNAIIGSAVTVGRGLIGFEVTVSGYTGGSGFDLLQIVFQANTRAADTTWEDIGCVVLGDVTAIGAARTSLTAAQMAFFNDANYQVRAYSYIQGSATAATVTIDAYPVPTANG